MPSYGILFAESSILGQIFIFSAHFPPQIPDFQSPNAQNNTISAQS